MLRTICLLLLVLLAAPARAQFLPFAMWGQPRCNDGIKNGQETGVDCGGTCGGCALGGSCRTDSDCATRVCGSDNLCRYPTSCAEVRDRGLHTGNPASGAVYTIDPDGLASGVPAFDAYCDMSIAGGGWTLLLVGGSYGDDFSSSDPFWLGNRGTNATVAVRGSSISSASFEKVMKYLPFKTLFFDTGDATWSFAYDSAAPATTFAQKKSAGTGWTTNTAGLSAGNCATNGLAWNRVHNGTHTQGQAMLGCALINAAGYGDNYVWGMGVYATRLSSNSCGPSCQGGTACYETQWGDPCGVWYLTGLQQHRGTYRWGSLVWVR